MAATKYAGIDLVEGLQESARTFFTPPAFWGMALSSARQEWSILQRVFLLLVEKAL